MIIRMEARHWERTHVGGERYLCVRQGEELVVIQDRCKHKGGPLSLGSWDERTQCITCPWHDLVNTPQDLARRQVPSVRVGPWVTAIVPEPT
jgi:nitrite reductase/ring-hydroxylating ferredoxin subunit